jgi:hypothetical protein
MMKPLVGCLIAAALALAPASAQVDVNGDGRTDVQNILAKIDELAKVGVMFDDEDTKGHIPTMHKDGKYHMACVDLPIIVYRAAGYDLAGAMLGKPLLNNDVKPEEYPSGKFRQIVHMLKWMKASPDFNFYPAPAINLNAHPGWRPKVPFRVGDLFFVHYDDASDRHSGIVTGVDHATGLPTHITQVSIYNENQGMHRSTLEEFFQLRCRVLTGYARPASWDGGKLTGEVLAMLEKESKVKQKGIKGHSPAAQRQHEPRRPQGPAIHASRQRRSRPATYVTGSQAPAVYGAPVQPAQPARRSRRGGARSNGAAAAASAYR